jgi:hypothetical protein
VQGWTAVIGVPVVGFSVVTGRYDVTGTWTQAPRYRVRGLKKLVVGTAPAKGAGAAAAAGA